MKSLATCAAVWKEQPVVMARLIMGGSACIVEQGQ
jgi:hypothetical protein